MEEIWKYLGLQYEVLNGGQEDIRGVCSSHWLWDKTWYGLATSGAGLTYSKLNLSSSASSSLSISGATLSTTATGELQLNGDNIITRKDLDALKLELAELKEQLKDK